MNKEKLVSVIMPIYNVGKFLEECLESVIHQTYKNLEIILIDDGSKDNSPEICDKYAKIDKRIKVIHQENKGLSAARNAGLDFFKGEYVYFIDSDDFVDSNAISRCVELIEKDNSDIASFYFHYVDEDSKEIVPFVKKDIKPIWNVDDFWDNISCFGDAELTIAAVVVWNKLFKREIFDNVRFEVGRINEDSFIIPDIIRNVKTISFINEPLYSYRKRSNSIMSRYDIRRMVDSSLSLIKRCDYFNEFNYSHYFAGNYRTVIVDYYEIKKHHKELSDSQKLDYLFIKRKIKEFYKLSKKDKNQTKKDKFLTFVSYRFPHLFILSRKIKNKRNERRK